MNVIKKNEECVNHSQFLKLTQKVYFLTKASIQNTKCLEDICHQNTNLLIVFKWKLIMYIKIQKYEMFKNLNTVTGSLSRDDTK